MLDNMRRSHDMALLESRLWHVYIIQYQEKSLHIFTKIAVKVTTRTWDFKWISFYFLLNRTYKEYVQKHAGNN